MENGVLIALLTKLVDERLASFPAAGRRGPRGPAGPPGLRGQDFDFSVVEPKIRAWVKEFALKFEDLSAEEIEELRGPRGRDGDSFSFPQHQEEIQEIIFQCVQGLSEALKLKFSDLSAEEIEELRGPRGRDGRNGRDFNFEEHREFFQSLRLKFSDLTDIEKETLKLRFSHLSDEEKASLKLQFKDLKPEDLALIRGPRGPRGQRGSSGKDGERGITGSQGPRGLPGPQGIQGISGLSGQDGQDGKDGQDGQDAPHVVAIEIEGFKDSEIAFVFIFSDGSRLMSDRVKLPDPVNVYAGGAVGGGKMNYDKRIDEVSDALIYVGQAVPGNLTSASVWQISRITVSGTQTIVEFADGNDEFDNVWNNRSSLTYG